MFTRHSACGLFPHSVSRAFHRRLCSPLFGQGRGIKEPRTAEQNVELAIIDDACEMLAACVSPKSRLACFMASNIERYRAILRVFSSSFAFSARCASSGFTLVRSETSLLSKSNQNGAPSVIAIAVSAQPRSCDQIAARAA